MAKDNPFRRAIASRQNEVEPTEVAEIVEPVQESSSQLPAPVVPPPMATDTKKRGRPATGKRSDSAWIGRTFYIKRETDLDVEELLLKLRREGRDIDKSELADFLLSAWVKWQKGEISEIQLSEISPIQKSKSVRG